MGLTKIEQLAADHLALAHWVDVRPGARIRVGSKKALFDALEAKSPGVVERARTRYDRRLEAERFKGSPPGWAIRMVRKHTSGSKLTWRRSRTKPWASGHCGYVSGAIVVTAGSGGDDKLDAKITMAHEIAHAKEPWGHHERFYGAFYEVLKAENLYREALKRGRGEAQGLRAAARRARQKGAA